MDREEWSRWWVRAKVWLGFGDKAKGQRTDESLGALLARREQVWQDRPTGDAPAPAPAPDLFKPKSAPPSASPGDTPLPTSTRPTGGPNPPSTSETAAEAPDENRTGTTSRLLEAKRRAQRKK
jgi:hypothetical protein